MPSSACCPCSPRCRAAKLARAMLEDVLQALAGRPPRLGPCGLGRRRGDGHGAPAWSRVPRRARQPRPHRGGRLRPAGSARHGRGSIPDHSGRRPVRHRRRGHAVARGAAARAWRALRPVAAPGSGPTPRSSPRPTSCRSSSASRRSTITSKRRGSAVFPRWSSSLPGLGLDIDAPEDLALLLERGAETRSAALLRAWGLPARLAGL